MNFSRKITLAVTAAILFLAGQPLLAESPEHRDTLKSEIRIGLGDQMFEWFVWQNPQYTVRNLSESWTRDYKEHYRYSQHLFAEYRYRLSRRVSLGFQVDGSAVVWDLVTRNGLGDEVSRAENQNFWNLTLMPTAQLTWVNREHYSLYSGVGIGLGINGGTETDAYGHHTLCGVAANLTFIGATFEWGSDWFAFAELGGLYSFRDIMTSIYMLNSRLISVGAGYRF